MLIMVFLSALTSCRKTKPLFDGQNCTGSCYILTGKLLESQSNLPLPGTELKFYYRPSGNPMFWDPTKYLGKVITATDGSYSFSFESKNFQSGTGYFRIEGYRNGYIYRNAGDMIDNNLLIFYLDSSKINIPQVNNLTLYKSATLKIKVNASTITNFSSLTVSYGFGTNGFGPALNGNRQIDTTLIYKTAADIPTIISWNAVGNGVNIQKRDTVIVQSGSEYLYQINL